MVLLSEEKEAGDETPENADGEDADWDEEDETDREEQRLTAAKETSDYEVSGLLPVRGH